MSHLYSHLSAAKTILEKYNGEMPFGAFIKKYFSAEKKYGSRDRKTISSLCYNYFRIAFTLGKKSLEEKLLTGLFLFTDAPNEILLKHSKEWNDNTNLPVKEKAILAEVDINAIFPFNIDLSAQIDAALFGHSLLVQPDLFIRTRTNDSDDVKRKLIDANIEYRQINDTCFSFANGTKLETTLIPNKEVVIQDLNSQRVGEMFQLADLPAKPKVWDCCAGSGGKSIMAVDYVSDIALTVSDIRPPIIHNLKKRFTEAGIRHYQSFVADVTNATNLKKAIGLKRFDLIICDAPCSGSGTWGRTPEQLLYFKKNKIINYSNLQKKIAINAVPYLATKGYFLYITCSAFKKENEDVVAFILQQSDLKLVNQVLLTGYEDRADTMFAALFAL